MTDEQVRAEIALLRKHRDNGAGIVLGPDACGQIADHLEATIADREQAAQDSCGVVAGYGHMMARDLKLELDGGWCLYGFACAEHGLCYWQVNQPGEPMCNQPIWSAPKGYRELHAGDVLCCQECGEKLGWCCGDPDRQPLVDKVPAFSARQLGCLQPLVERAMVDAPLTVVYRLANVLTRCDECGCAMELSAGVEDPVCGRCAQAAQDREDAGRVERVRQALDAEYAKWTQDPDMPRSTSNAIWNIRAALDGPQGGGDGG